jgi:hypothetical protein
MIWAILGGAVIIILPLIELLQSFRGKTGRIGSKERALGVKIDATKSTEANGKSIAA